MRRTRRGRPAYWHFLSTGAFIDGLASNWQAAVLQLGSRIVFGSFLYQRGAPHSLDPGKVKRKHERREVHRFTWFYRNSLLVAFLLLFVLALGLHIVFGTAYNEEITLAGQPPISITAHLSASARIRRKRKPLESRNATTGEANK